MKQTIQLYCDKCKCNHEFEMLDVERLVYGLQAELAEALTADHNSLYYDQFKGMSALDVEMCLKENLQVASDSEGYGEYTSGMIEQRMENWI